MDCKWFCLYSRLAVLPSLEWSGRSIDLFAAFCNKKPQTLTWRAKKKWTRLARRGESRGKLSQPLARYPLRAAFEWRFDRSSIGRRVDVGASIAFQWSRLASWIILTIEMDVNCGFREENSSTCCARLRWSALICLHLASSAFMSQRRSNFRETPLTEWGSIKTINQSKTKVAI